MRSSKRATWPPSPDDSTPGQQNHERNMQDYWICSHTRICSDPSLNLRTWCLPRSVPRNFQERDVNLVPTNGFNTSLIQKWLPWTAKRALITRKYLYRDNKCLRTCPGYRRFLVARNRIDSLRSQIKFKSLAGRVDWDDITVTVRRLPLEWNYSLHVKSSLLSPFI